MAESDGRSATAEGEGWDDSAAGEGRVLRAFITSHNDFGLPGGPPLLSRASIASDTC